MSSYKKILDETRAAFEAKRPLPPRPLGPRGRMESDTELSAKAAAHSWKWDKIEAELKTRAADLQASPCNLDYENDYEGADPGEHRVVVMLGSYAISPSGKVYMPWAHSNLTPCPACKGIGRRKPRNEIERIHVAENARLDAGEDGEEPVRWTGTMTEQWSTYIDRRNTVVEVWADGTLTCNECRGCQYAEAEADSVWNAEMERIADERGLSFDQDDGDYYVALYFTVNADEEEV